MPKPNIPRLKFPLFPKIGEPKKPECPACEDTGRDSKGRQCHPCLISGRIKTDRPKNPKAKFS